MGLFSFFKKQKTDPVVDNNSTTANDNARTTTIPRGLFVDDVPPEKEVKDIEAIKKFVNTDFTRKGYNDALVNYDNSQMLLGLQIIRGQLIYLFREVTDHYQSEISELNVRITKCTNDGLLDLANRLEAEKNIREQQISNLEKMKEDFNNGEDYMCIMIHTYEIGFRNGIAAQLYPGKP